METQSLLTAIRGIYNYPPSGLSVGHSTAWQLQGTPRVRDRHTGVIARVVPHRQRARAPLPASNGAPLRRVAPPGWHTVTGSRISNRGS
jgi:hypothetical protein